MDQALTDALGMSKDISGMHPIAIFGFGVTLAIIIAAKYFGTLQGRLSSNAPTGSQAQVAAVIVDPTALNNLTAVAKELVQMIRASNDLAERHCKNQEHLNSELAQMRQEMTITREVNRQRGL